MRSILNDIRLLKLAELYENAFEAFVLEIAERTVDDAATRDELMHLVDPEDQHGERIAAELQRLNADVTPEEHMEVLRAAVMDVCDTERAAREFYLRHIDRVHDPQVTQLFRELAEAEGRHARIADHALRALERRIGASASTTNPLRLSEDAQEAPPRWEGSADLVHDADREAHRLVRP